MTFMEEEKLNSYKLDFLDFSLICRQDCNPPKELDLNNIKNGNLYYKSNKFLLSNGQIFQSYADYLNKRPIEQLQPTFQQVVEANLDKLFPDNQYLYFSEKI